MTTALTVEPPVKQEKIIQLDVPVDDNIYSMQDKYNLPYTTVDEQGNTTVSVVEKVEVSPPSKEFPERDFMEARLHVKLFHNQSIKVEPIPATGDEKDPHEREFVDSTMNSIEHNAKEDRYMKQIYNTLFRSIPKSTSTSTLYSDIKGLNYTVYENEEDLTTSNATILRPYLYKTRIRENSYIENNTATNSYITQTCNTSVTQAYNTWNWFENTGSHHVKYWKGQELAHPVINAVERLRAMIRDRIAPAAIVRREVLGRTTDIREIRARQTLRRLIGESAYQKYACRGFITFKGESDRTYQIFPGHGKVAVWQKGKQIEQLCVILSGDFPPTDSVIMRLLLIQESEERFKKVANVFPAYAPGLSRAEEVPQKSIPLPEIFADLKIQQSKSLRALVA